MHNYIIETERLILRPLKIDDAEAVYQWVSDERVAKYMVYNTYTSLQEIPESGRAQSCVNSTRESRTRTMELID